MQTQVFLDTMCQLTSWLRQAPEAQKRWVKSQKLGYIYVSMGYLCISVFCIL